MVTTLAELKATFNPAETGQEMYRLAEQLYPLCRSITGEGFRETLRQLQNHIPLQLHEVASGTPVFDWTVPPEWNIRDAYVADATGRRIIDFRRSNLHLVSYSTPVRQKMDLAELKKHLFSLPDQPDWIPYRTSYYNESWGFCLPHRQLVELEEGQYEVCIDATLAPGHLTYGEYYLPGDSPQEVLISCHACHPSLCNDNLSGIGLATFLAKYLSKVPRRYSYRFIFIPGTIGSITWLALHQPETERIKHGLVVTGVGDPGGLTYKKSRRGDTEIDRAVAYVLQSSGRPHNIIEFFPYGYDERQYCSPGLNLAVGRLSRTPHGQYPQYHTSADNLEFIQPGQLGDALECCLSVVYLLEHNRTYLNLSPKGEPQLGKRGLYRAVGGQADAGQVELGLLWVLNLSDGQHSLLDIAERSGLDFPVIVKAALALEQHNLLREVPGD